MIEYNCSGSNLQLVGYNCSVSVLYILIKQVINNIQIGFHGLTVVKVFVTVNTLLQIRCMFFVTASECQQRIYGDGQKIFFCDGHERYLYCYCSALSVTNNLLQISVTNDTFFCNASKTVTNPLQIVLVTAMCRYRVFATPLACGTQKNVTKPSQKFFCDGFWLFVTLFQPLQKTVFLVVVPR